MEYRVTFYRTEAGEKPVAEFLESLQGRNDTLHKLVTAGLRKLKLRENHGLPLTAPVHGSSRIMELRVGRTDIARVFFFFQPEREIVCTNGYVKKSQKLDPAEVARAERCKTDWERRFPSD
ncbi:MAG: type II toxin-antitoxin system RelE/ParE family toxin [Chloroflexia bacterium]|nr:type II toxin-antitoxin system RelE/ParE family toxin [Chloroflexia bacterium]